jgi:hypothetical protein
MRVVFEFDSQRGRRAFRATLALAAAVAVAYPVWLYASPVGALITFKPGQVIRAADVNSNFQTIADAVDDNDSRIGNLATLQTTAKTDLVSAVNEVKTQGVSVGAPLTGSGTSASPLTIGTANGTTTGALTATDWTTFNSKLTTVATDATLTGNGTTGSNLSVRGVASGTIRPAGVAGQLFFDTTFNTLLVSDGTNWNLTGPRTQFLPLGTPYALYSLSYTSLFAAGLTFTKATDTSTLVATVSVNLDSPNPASGVTLAFQLVLDPAPGSTPLMAQPNLDVVDSGGGGHTPFTFTVPISTGTGSGTTLLTTPVPAGQHTLDIQASVVGGSAGAVLGPPQVNVSSGYFMVVEQN